MDFDLLYQSVQEVLETAELVVAFASALVGFLGGWFGRRKKEKRDKTV